MNQQELTRRQASFGMAVPTGNLHRFVLVSAVKHVLEVEDVLFHFESAVLLPDAPAGPSAKDGGAPTESSQSKLARTGYLQRKSDLTLTGLAVIHAALASIEQNPERRLVIAGHTDTSGKARFNFELSEARARAVLAVLTGDADLWASVCGRHQRLEDVQQILKHFAHLLHWRCDPGPIDNDLGDKTRLAAEVFHQMYDSSRPELSLGGGPLGRSPLVEDRFTEAGWRAVFAVYQWELALAVTGMPATTGLRALREKVRFVDVIRRVLPCGESFPVEQSERKNYRSQKNRRVELLLLDPSELPETLAPGIRDSVFTAAEVPLYDRRRYRTRHLEKPPHSGVIPLIDLQTVDTLGQRVGDAEVIVVAEGGGGREITIRSDASGTARLYAIPAGRIRFLTGNRQPARFIAGEELVEAVLEPRAALSEIVTLIVRTADPQNERARHEQREVYRRKGHGEGIIDDEAFGTAAAALKRAFGLIADAVTKPVPRASLRYAYDNLLMAAGIRGWQKDPEARADDLGFELAFDPKHPLHRRLPAKELLKPRFDFERLLKQVLPVWLEDYYPSVTRRGWFLLLIRNQGKSQSMTVFDDHGQELGSFEMLYMATSPHGLYGVVENVDANAFGDLATLSGGLGLRTRDGQELDHQVPIDEGVVEDQREKFRALVQSRGSAVMLVYNAHDWPANYTAALFGGTGTLELYGSDAAVNRHVRERNLATLRTHLIVYKMYIARYIDELWKVTSESDLRRLGPPLSWHRFMVPETMGDHTEEVDNLNEDAHSASRTAWLAIYDVLGAINGIDTSGMFFKLNVNLKLIGGGEGETTSGLDGEAEYEFEYNFDLDPSKRRMTHVDHVIRTTVVGLPKKMGPFSGGIQHEVDVETGEVTSTGVLKIGERFRIELSTDGTAEVELGALGLEAGPEGVGGKIIIPLGDNARIECGVRVNPPNLDVMDDSAMIALVTHAPGFFERRPLDELLSRDLQWNDLTYVEQLHLQTLGFDRMAGNVHFWDVKHERALPEFPASAREDGFDLPFAQKRAAVHLGFNLLKWRERWEAI